MKATKKDIQDQELGLNEGQLLEKALRTHKTSKSVLRRMLELQGMDTAQAEAEREVLSRVHRLMKASRASGEVSHFDPVVAQTKAIPTEDRDKLYREARNSDELRQAVAEYQKQVQERHHLALPMTAYAFTKQIPLIKDKQGLITDELNTEIYQELPGLSEPHACLAAFVTALGHEVQAERMIGVIPTQKAKVTKDQAAKYGVPYPETVADFEEVKYGYDDDLQEWVTDKVFLRMLKWCEERGLYPVSALPRGNANVEGWSRITILACDLEIVHELCDYVDQDTGNKLGGETVHYLQALFSNADSRPSVGPDGITRLYPDYRLVNYTALSVDEMDKVSKLLGMQQWLSDGSGFYIHRTPSITQMIEETLEIEGRHLSEDEAKARIKKAERLHSLECQFRATEILNVGNKPEMQWLAKGTHKVLHIPYVEKQLRKFEEEWGVLMGNAISEPTDSNYSKLTQFLAEYGPAYGVLVDMLGQDGPAAILVKGDQIKVRPDRTAGMRAGRSDWGVMVFVGTYLRGSNRRIYETRQDALGESLEPQEAQIIRIEQTGSVHVVDSLQDKTWAGHHKPTQYRPNANAQVFQFATNKAAKGLATYLDRKVRSVAENLKTTAGIASLISEEEADRRRRANQEELDREITGVDRGVFEPESYNDLDLLREAMRSGLIRMRSAAVAKAMKGEVIEWGEVLMLEPMVARLDALVAARAKGLLRSFGLSFYGYHHTNCANSIKLLRKLWGLEGLADYPFEDESTVYMPQAITRRINADDDGDITQGIAAVLPITIQEQVSWVSDTGRTHTRVSSRTQYVKVVMIMRYPCVDAPILWALPADVPTPWDASTEAEDQDFKEVLSALAPEMPDWFQDFDDKIIIMKSDRLFRLSDSGAKEGIEKKKLYGEVSLKSSFKLVMRKINLHSTGSLTRRLERYAVLIMQCLQMIDLHGKGKYDGQKYGPILQWQLALEDWSHSAFITMLLLELQLTGFKYDVTIPRTPAMALGAEYDPNGCDKDYEYYGLIPQYHHDLVGKQGLRRVLRKHHRDHTVMCLEDKVRPRKPRDEEGELCTYKQFKPLNGMGKETLIINYVLKRAGNQVITGLDAIQTDLAPFVRELERTIEEKYPTEPNQDEQYEIKKVIAALEDWRTFWREVFQHVQNLEDHVFQEVYKIREQFIGHAAEAIRQKMQDIGDSVSEKSLAYAVAKVWREAADQVKSLMEAGQYEAADRLKRQAASVVALIEGRMAKLFPYGAVEVEVQNAPLEHAEFFTKGQDMPGPIGGVVEFAGILPHPDGNIYAKYVHPDGTEDTYALFHADGQDKRVSPPYARRLKAVKTSQRRVLVSW